MTDNETVYIINGGHSTVSYVEGAIDHWIYVKSGDRKDSNGGTITINVILYDDRGQKTPEIRLDIDVNHEGKTTDVFQVPPEMVKKFGNVVQVEMYRESCPSPDWFCEVIMVNDTRSQVKEKCYYFPVQRWALPEFHYLIRVNDTCLRVDDPYEEQRQYEIGEARVQYDYNPDGGPGLPAQAKQIPDTEIFSDFKRFDLNREQDILLSHHPLKRLLQPTPYPKLWNTLVDLLNIYDDQVFPKPWKAEERWSRDDLFGSQRLIGCNPGHIRLCTELPENMGVTVEMLRQPLEGWSLKQIIEAKRLYIVDHSILDDLPTKDGRPICAPMALMFITSKKTLVPIAIQLYQDIAPDNPVFLPSDSSFTWFLAKMWFNMADASVNLALSHFGCIQMVMESISIAMHRTLAPNHPVYRLLSPHLLYLVAVNGKTLSQLLEPGGWVDEVTTMGRDGLYELIRRGMQEWRLDVQGTFPKEMESRGLLDKRTLPQYAYRDDGLMLHKCIETYVKKVLKHYYTETSILRADTELSSWAAEMALPKEQGGAGIKGIPNNGRIRHIDDLILVCTSVIFSCSVQHTAVTSNMYEEYGFPPNYPILLHGAPPSDKEALEEEDLVKALPDQRRTMLTLSMTKLLSNREERGLGEWDFQFQYDTVALLAEKEFKEELQRISKHIQQRNANPEEPNYPFLDPENIANFIQS